MISVVILTKNEENDLPTCLNSVSWSDDVHVLDSGSTDRTQDIARAWGAKVSLHPFESFGSQRNYALEKLEIRHEWILFLDADEVVTQQFHKAMLEAINLATADVAGYYCCWKMMLEGRWLKRCDNFPKWQFRLLRKDKARFTDFGHGQKEAEVTGEILYIKEPYLHYSFSKGWTQWMERHNRYSSQEAMARLTNTPPLKNIFARHSSVRNPALKSWLSKLPGWPLLRFFQAYFLSLGFLEGSQGFIYCINMAYYEFLIQIKSREIIKRGDELLQIDLHHAPAKRELVRSA
ncbi:glycosyltransferase family 2 protein [Cesiribacter sp. SM1]|uniref:glycosyltransferase family 2 protein n=1 Tax=Cesiribacter sp. SM1 TaxID=2861196 RepID=UPI001CD2E9F2|nr:glycosyltransferase family 2 protein [Cesiribacter sp. SM1]